MSARCVGCARALAAVALLAAAGAWAAEPLSLEAVPAADTLVRSLDPTHNYGVAGGLAVSGDAARNGSDEQMGLLDTFIRFDLAELVQQMDAHFGSHAWKVQRLTLRLTEQGAPFNPIFNRGVGRFEVRWIAADGWAEGTGSPRAPSTDGIAYQDEATLLNPALDTTLGAFWNAGADGELEFELPLSQPLVDEVRAGAEVSLFLTAVDATIGFTFNSRDVSGDRLPPRLAVTASLPATGPLPPVAEPVEPVTATSLLANWAAGGNPTGTLYLVECWEGSGFAGTKLGESGWQTAGSFDFTGLTPNTGYSLRVQAGVGDELSAWTELTSGGIHTLAAVPGPLAVDGTAMIGGRLNVNGPAPRSLGVEALGLNGNPAATRMALRVGSDGPWLRVVFEGAELRADGQAPDWRAAAEWAGRRLRGLSPGTAYAFFGQARNEAGEPTVVTHVGAASTNRACDVNRSGCVTALDYALVRCHGLRGGEVGVEQPWPCDVDDSGAVDCADAEATRLRVLTQ